ncbi:MAG: hypothetical protein ACTSRU_08280 [Candidatus Hodarchaeales archaeon]
MSVFENKKTLLGILSIVTVLALLSILPAVLEFPGDGLEHVGTEEFTFNSLLEGIAEVFSLGLADDYDFLGLGPIMGSILSALFGTAILLFIFGGIFIILRIYRKRFKEDSSQNTNEE